MKGKVNDMAYQNVFKRVEKKYLVDEETYIKLMDKLKDHIVPDQYGKSTICNIYYDTPDRRLIRTSLEKPVYKEKFRVRSYGTASSGSTVFVELKKKYKGVVYKRRTSMTLEQSDDFISNQVFDEKNLQIQKELNYFLNLYENIGPAMFISYDRLAFCGKIDPELRITFDRNITYREEELSLDHGIWGTQLLNEGERIMEIKIPGAMPLWLSKILNDLKIYPTSFSKYGTAYRRVTDENLKKGKVNYCA